MAPKQHRPCDSDSQTAWLSLLGCDASGWEETGEEFRVLGKTQPENVIIFLDYRLAARSFLFKPNKDETPSRMA